MRMRISSVLTLLVAVLGLTISSWASSTYTFANNLGEIVYSGGTYTEMCSFEPSFGAPLAWTSYTYGNYYNISYQNSNSSPTINQPLQNFSFVYGSTPNIGYNNNCPANTSANLTFQGSGFSINYGGTYTPFWEVLVP